MRWEDLLFEPIVCAIPRCLESELLWTRVVFKFAFHGQRLVRHCGSISHVCAVDGAKSPGQEVTISSDAEAIPGAQQLFVIDYVRISLKTRIYSRLGLVACHLSAVLWPLPILPFPSFSNDLR
jgi:hypothetical protein